MRILCFVYRPWTSFGLIAAVAQALAPIGVIAVGESAPVASEPAQAADGPVVIPPVLRAEPYEAARSDVNDDNAGTIAGGGGNCVPIGSFLTRAPGNSTLRGNMFRVLSEATVSAFGFELDIDQGQPKALYFSVHRVPSGGGATFTRVIDDVVMNVVGSGDPELYTTGDLPTPVQLDVDSFYVFGVSWGGSGVATGRNPAQSSTPGSVLPGFPVATYIGEANVPLPGGGSPPIDPDDNGVVMFAEQSAPWSSQICLAGACCLPDDTCAELSEGECQSDGGSFTNAGQTCDQLMAEGLGCPLTLGACCTSNQACSSTSKFTCEDLGGEDWFQGEACNATICIPTGACCVGDGECSDVREAECESNGGHYRGDGTTCAGVEPRCTVGACCFGEACSALSSVNCNTKGGNFQGHGVACAPDNPCLPTGACCQGNSCSDFSEPQCNNDGGVYRGDNTTCANLVVPCGRGACCSDAGCFQTTQSTCDLVGNFEGEGTSCATIFPPCAGTCCWLGGCEDDIDPLSCAGADGLPDGLFVGYDDSCSDDPCAAPAPGGACCLDTGDCLAATSATCADLLGTYSGDDSTCDSITCLPALATGACCLEGGTCEIRTADNCTGDDIYRGDDTVCVDACVFGACCVPAGGCELAIESECQGLNGEFNAGFDCTSGICPDGSACCLPDGTCTPRRDVDLCDGLDGMFQGGMLCADVNCTRGACCLDVGGCEVGLEGDCLAPDEFRGANTVCPDSCELGACCLPDGCVETDRLNCTNLGGVFQLDLDCATANCPPGGACCVSDGACEVRFPEDCITPARFQGNDTVCDGVCDGACCVNNGCQDDTELVECTGLAGVFFGNTACVSDVCNTQRGACCHSGGTCDVVFDVQCSGEEVLFRGAGTTCAQACDPGACCLGDGSCEDTDNLSCDQIVGAVFQPNNLCAEDNCPGACCTGVESCFIASRSVCESGQGAAFIGAATDCADAAQCELGACCHLDGTCDQLFAFECDAPLDTFTAGVDCGSVECTTRGACCVGGACSEVTPDECVICSGGPNDGQSCKSDEDCGICAQSNEPCSPQTPCANVCSHDFAVPCDTSDDCVETGMCIAQTCDTKSGMCEFDGSGCETDTDCNDVCTNDSNTSCTINDDCTMVVGTCEQQTCDGGDCGEYFGDGVACIADACADSACCVDDGSCQDTLNELPYSALQCTLDGGHPIANSVCDPGVCPAAGACCFGDDNCQQLTEAACIEMDGIYAGDKTSCDGFTCAQDACCLLDGSCTEELFGFQCTPDIGDPFSGFTCATVEDGGLCSPRGACCDGVFCSVQTQESCVNGGGTFQSVGLLCDPNPCQVCPDGVIVFHNPDGAADGNWYDARQPHELNDANMLQGRSVFMASGPEGAADLSCWELCETNNNPALHPGLAPNDITQVTDLGGGSYEIVLARPIAQAEVTRLRYVQSGDTAWFRYLPGDVNMDETSAPADILGVIDCLNGVAGFPCNLANTDTDRSDEAGPPDILRVIDLLNGASQLEVWLDAALDQTGCE